MSDSKLSRALLDGLVPADWYKILNRRVFFWVRRERLERLLAARACRDTRQTVLTVDTCLLLNDYVMKANAGNGNTSDINTTWTQTLWSPAYIAGGSGDISFGSAEEAGPITSYSDTLGGNASCPNCETPWPGMMSIYQTGVESKAFRIGWGEGGSEAEGWFPWWSGTIRVR